MADNPSEREVRNDALIRSFMDVFEGRDSTKLLPFLADDIVFQNYGDPQINGAAELAAMWAGVFRTFAQVRFETVNQAVDGDTVIAEQIHGLALPGGKLAPVMNLAVYEIRGGKIAAWRDYGNPQYAMKLLGME